MAKQTHEEANQRRALFSAITGRSSAGTTGASEDVKGMLSNVYGVTRTVKGKDGTTRTVSGVDTREAAKRLGVTQRTVQRWLIGENKPSDDHLKKIRTRSRQAATTKRGRARAVKRAMQEQTKAAIRTPGALGPKEVKVAIHGHQGPHGGGPPYGRVRNSQMDISPEQYQQFLEIYTESGDAAASNYLETLFSKDYVDGWTFNTIEAVSIGPGGNNGRGDPRAL